MATLVELAARGDLERYDPQLPPRQQELRSFYAFPRLAKFLVETLPNLGSTWNIEVSPLEQFDALAAEYCAGEVLTFGNDFNPLRYLKAGCWELKTADLRMFGWFAAKDCFIGVSGHTAQHVKEHKLYAGLAGEVVRSREQLDLDDPKFVPGQDPTNVVSSFNYP